MKSVSPKKIFARRDPAGFVGRTPELDRLLSCARGENDSKCLVILAAPFTGASELLRQVYDRLFIEQDEIIPFYFELKVSDVTARSTATRFLREFLLQTVAFRRRDPKIIDRSPALSEIAELALPADGYWIDRLVETRPDNDDLSDTRSFIRNCLSAPLRAAANGALPFVMIDDLSVSMHLDGGGVFVQEIIDVFSRATIPTVFAGQRRFLFARTPFETMHLDQLSFADAGRMAERLSALTGVAINDQTRDLIAVQLGGNAGYIDSLFAAAASNGNDLNDFASVEQTYTDEIFGGLIGKKLSAILDLIIPDPRQQFQILGLLHASVRARGGRIPVTYWKKHSGMTDAEFEAALDALNYHEIISVSSGAVVIDSENIVLRDYIRGRSRLEIDGKPRALAVGETLRKNVERAPRLMAGFYRNRSAIGLRELMRAFDGRLISPALIDYGRFKNEFKGADDEKILKALKEDNEKLSLPRIVYTAHTIAFYPRLAGLCDAERSAVALGFTGGSPGVEEAVWIAAEIDSKLEASRESAEFWCNRLEMVALNCNFSNAKLWLIAPEGFAPDALQVLGERNAYGSSRKQADLLAGILGADVEPKAENTAHEYEIVVPMGGDPEMIAAHTIEDIAKRHNFPPKAINQIKTALVEACINAAEHSLSPDRRIYQKFTVDAEKITITVSNRGIRLADKEVHDATPNEGRRGWGLKLIQGLMDDVKIEQTDDGTRLTMVKYIAPAQP